MDLIQARDLNGVAVQVAPCAQGVHRRGDQHQVRRGTQVR